MGCNCGKNRQSAAQPRRAGTTGTASSQEFALTMPSGDKAVYGSRLEADAANARSGYKGVVKPVGQ